MKYTSSPTNASFTIPDHSSNNISNSQPNSELDENLKG